MKKAVYIIHVLFAMLSFCNINAAGVSGLKYDSLSCLQIEGSVTNVEAGDGECLVELISANEVLQTLVLKEGKHKFKFVLAKNSFYSIRISKSGFITKLVSVNTEMLTEHEGIHVFKFETGLMTSAIAHRLNQDIIDFPVTIIQYDYESESFIHNAKYTAYIKRELYKPEPVKVQKNKPAYAVDATNLAYAANLK